MLVADPDVAGGERAKLLDFGIAKVTDDPKNPGGGVKTRTGMMMGTPAYMAPEQCRGAGEVDERADVYSLGIMFYEMLTGRAPFTDSAPGELIARHLFDQPPTILSLVPSVPTELAALVHKMLAKRADERPSMLSIVQQLDALGSPSDATFGPTPVPMPRTLVEPSSPGPGTLTQAPSQSGTGGHAAPLSKARTRLIATGVFGCTLLAGALAWRLGGSQPERKVSAVPAPSENLPAAAVSLPIKSAAPETNQAPEAESTLPPAKRKVKWLIRSTPPGATIIQESDQTRLGQTPWTTESSSTIGEEKLLLRLPGDEDTSIDVPRDRDTDFHVEMTRIEEPKTAPVARMTGMTPLAPVMKRNATTVAPVRPVATPTTPKQLDASPKPSTPAVEKRNPQKTNPPTQSSGKGNKAHDDFELLD